MTAGILAPRLADTYRRRFLNVLLIIAVCAGVVWFVETPWLNSWDFRHGLWSPAFLLVRGMNPYGFGAPAQIVRSVWFPSAIGLYFPLGWMAEFEASNLWFLINVFALLMLLWLVRASRHVSLATLASSLLIIFLFPPVLSHLLLGQFSIMAMLSFVVAAQLISHDWKFPAAFMIALTITKPQLGIFAIPGFLVFVWRTQGFKSMLWFLFAVAFSLIWLTLPVWLVHPNWIDDFLEIMRTAPTWLQPTLLTMMRGHFGNYGYAIWACMAIAALCLNTWLWAKYPPVRAIEWSLAITCLIGPYLWSWDFVLLLPLMIGSMMRLLERRSSVILILGYAICMLMILWIRLTTDNSDERFWSVPLLLTAVVCMGYLAQRFSMDRKREAVLSN